MKEQFYRTAILFGNEAISRLQDSKVAVFGIGGVGGHAVEALARAGVGHFILVDNDTVSVTNINRQIIATHDTVGCDKVLVMQERIKAINPEATVKTYKQFYLPQNASSIELTACDYIIDAIDTVTAKIFLVMEADRLNIPIISSMGTGNKINPCMLEVADIYNTSVCPLAKVMRKELKNRGIQKLKVVYSKEEPIKSRLAQVAIEKERPVPGSTSFVPSVAGLIIASEVVKDICKEK